MVLPERFELSTSPLPRECSTPELRQRAAGGLDVNMADRKPNLDDAASVGYRPAHGKEARTEACGPGIQQPRRTAEGGTEGQFGEAQIPDARAGRFRKAQGIGAHRRNHSGTGVEAQMDSIIVKGGKTLRGEIPVAGAKNTCLKLMCAALLADEPLTLTNVPLLSDVATLTLLLESLGCEIARLQGGRAMVLSAAEITNRKADYEIVRKLRASFNVLGPLVGRCGEATVSLPGGCAIGARKVDLHLTSLERLGASIDLRDGYVHASAPNGLRGAEIEFPVVSVGATENAICAAALAKGTTVLRNAAREPDTKALADCLIAMGGQIEGAGTSTIIVEGVERLHGTTHRVIPDRIELGTYMIATGMAGGEVEFLDGRREPVSALADTLERADMVITETGRGVKVRRDDSAIRSVDVRTGPFPGFPTDLQAQMMALMCIADGTSMLEETVFENRFMHVPELIRMGADIDVQNGLAKVTGVERLKGAPVMATDLRASVSLILAGLAAEGETIVSRVYHLDRGYEQVEEKLGCLGARIERISKHDL